MIQVFRTHCLEIAMTCLRETAAHAPLPLPSYNSLTYPSQRQDNVQFSNMVRN